MAKNRQDVPSNLKWRLNDIFASIEDWNKLYDEVSKKLDFSSFPIPILFLNALETSIR